MSQVTFGGLATGLDTEAIVSSLMEVERAPVDALENDIEYLETQNETFDSFDAILSDLNSAISALDTASEFNSYNATTSSDDYLQASASSYTKPGTYQVEVVSLAQQQKDVSSEGFADSSTEELSGTITIGDEEISYDDVSLSQLADIVNEADTGVTASLVNDGTENGLRLVLTANDAETTPEILATGSITIDSASNGHTLDGSMAHVVVDGIDIYSANNTITEAIYGVTLDLVGLNEPGETSFVKVAPDTSSIEENVAAFVSSYNEMLTFIDELSAADSATGSEFRSLERKIQGMLTTTVSGATQYDSLASLGFETDSKTGELSYDASILNDALLNNLEDVQALFVGDDNSPGVAAQLSDYLSEQLSPTSGFVATKTASNDTTIERKQESVESMEARLAKREETLNAQYVAMELLVAELNSQADYLDSFFAEDSSS